MAVSALEGIVENGRIRLQGGVVLPDNTRVYVVVPDSEATSQAHVHTPRLAHPEQTDDFAKQVLNVVADARL